MSAEPGDSDRSPAAVLRRTLLDPATDRATSRLADRLRRQGVAVLICGVDGAGKTVLAKQLVAVARHGGLEARHLHVYRWWRNLFLVPGMLLANRFLGRRLLVFDRGIHDNLAYNAVRRAAGKRRSRLLELGAGGLARLYPRFDHRYYLTVPLELARQRRPDLDAGEHAQLSEAYGLLARVGGFRVVNADHQLLGQVLAELSDPA